MWCTVHTQIIELADIIWALAPVADNLNFLAFPHWMVWDLARPWRASCFEHGEVKSGIFSEKA
jgi:hypothetical protein